MYPKTPMGKIVGCVCCITGTYRDKATWPLLAVIFSNGRKQSGPGRRLFTKVEIFRVKTPFFCSKEVYLELMSHFYRGLDEAMET